MNAAVARTAARTASQASRSMHTTAVRQGGHGGDYEYLHAARMYSDQPKSKVKCGAAIFGGVAVALYIPYFAVQFSLKKAGLK